MSTLDPKQQDRRKVIKHLATGAVALPVLGLAGCGGGGGGEDAASAAADLASDAADAIADTASEAADAASNVVDAVAEEAQSAMETAEDRVADAIDAVEDTATDMASKAEDMAGDMADKASDALEDLAGAARLEESDAQAQGLGYKHDASEVDAATQPRYAAGQQCANCAVFQGGDAEWGPCPIFAGKQVKSTGWCSAYVAAG